MNSLSSWQQLLDYTSACLETIQKLAQFFDQRSTPAYRGPIGSHIRHLIEHYEALVYSSTSMVDYDSRRRDDFLEVNSGEAVRRIMALHQKLQTWSQSDLEKVVSVSTLGGLMGELTFKTLSSVGRELCFLNSHAVHHLAILRPICVDLGISVDEYFGYAPSTIAYLESQKLEV